VIDLKAIFSAPTVEEVETSINKNTPTGVGKTPT
jgi:hypothetical protein